MVYLSGGLSHQDTFDLKPDAPEGIRGEFKPIATKLPGVQVGELLPRTAAIMDKLAVIRSLVGQIDEHSSFQSMTGFPMGISPARGQAALRLGRLAGCRAPVDPVVPPFVDLFPVMQHRPYNTPGPGILGQAYQRRADGRRRPGAPAARRRASPPDRFSGRQRPARTSSTASAARSTAPRSTA